MNFCNILRLEKPQTATSRRVLFQIWKKISVTVHGYVRYCTGVCSNCGTRLFSNTLLTNFNNSWHSTA